MSDPSSLTLVHYTHAHTLERLEHHFGNPDEADTHHANPHLQVSTWHDEDYGATDAQRVLATEEITFIGSFGPGTEYGPYLVVGWNTEWDEYPCSLGNGPTVEIPILATPQTAAQTFTAQLRRLFEFLRLYRDAQRTLGLLDTGPPLLRTSEEFTQALDQAAHSALSPQT